MKFRVAFLFLAVILTAILALQSRAQSPVPNTLPTYVRFIEDETVAEAFEMSDSLFFKTAGAITFKVNKSNLEFTDPILKELDEWILPTIQRQEWELAGITLRGAASPEGPYGRNVQLSHERAKALTDFLLNRMGQSLDELLTTNTKAEDYDYLLYMMKDAADADADRVETLLAECRGNANKCKQALMRADGGTLWKRLLKEYFPKLRAARVVLFFKRRTMKPAMGATERLAFPLQKPQHVEDLILQMVETEMPIIQEKTRRHLLSVATNLLYDILYMPNFGWAPSPNIQLEYYPKEEGKWTYLAQFTSPYYTRWGRNKFFEIRDYHLEVRRYFNPGVNHTGAFAAAYLNANIYGIGFSKTKGWEGEGMGAALKAGYVWQLSQSGRWRLEASAAFGGYLTRFDPYVYGNPVTGTEDGDYYYDYIGQVNSFKKRNHQRVWFGPTELNLTLRYDLLYRTAKHGASFNRKEVAR